MKTEKEILEAVRVLQEANPHDEGIQNWVRNYFPELKESDDEKIRKKICKLLWDNAPYEEAQEYIAWLEKQGNPTEDELEALRMAAYEPTKNWSEKLQSLYEKLTHCEQKPVIEMKTPEESLGIDSDTYNKIVDECIYGEQKHTDNVEPKFHEGDNIEPIDTCLGSPRTIYKICDGFYETNQGTLDFEYENNWRLIEQKPAWSKEDELMLVSIIQTLKLTNGSAQMKIDWLKSLKERILPKSTWSEEDDVKINRIVACLENLNVADNDILLKDVDWLKPLKDRVGCEVNCTTKQQWKPSDEQIRELSIVSTGKGWFSKEILRELLEQLKKLREE